MIRFTAKKGAALLTVLAVLLVVVVLVNVILKSALTQANLSRRHLNRIRAQYAAQAGMNLALERLSSGNWQNNQTYAINCNSSACQAAVIPANRVVDAEIPYEVRINIGAPNSGPNNTTSINIATTFQ